MSKLAYKNSEKCKDIAKAAEEQFHYCQADRFR
jgi:hypothetical protein